MDPERSRVKNSIGQLQARGDLFARQLIQEKQRIGHLQLKLKQVNENIASLRDANKKMAMGLLNKHTTTPNDAYHRVDGVNPTRLAEANQKKIVKNLESRLGKALIRRNQIENENTEIKGKIDKLRRKIANDIKNRECMEKELIDIRADMDDIMKRAAVASDQREKLIDQRNQILAENNRRQAIFEKEYNELSAVIAKRAKSLEESISNAADNVVSMLSAADGHCGSNAAANGNSVDDTKQLEERLASLDKEYAETKKVLHVNEQKIRAYEEKFKELRDVSGLSSTEDIINTFVKNEEECFSIFNYIQAVNQDCDKTTEQASKLRADIDEYRQEQMEKERTRVTTVNVYEDNLREVKAEREKMHQTSIECRRTVETIAKRVTALYFKLKCNEIGRSEPASKNTVPEMLRSDRKLTTVSGGEVSEQNILNLMEMIETRSIQIVNSYLNSLTSSKRSRRPSLILSPKMFERAVATRSTPNMQTGFVMNLNELSDESDEETESSFSSSDDEDAGRPMSVHDMRRQAAECIKRPDSAAAPPSSAEKERIVQKNKPRHTVF